MHLQCLNGHFCNLYHLLAFLKEAQIPTVLTLHAEFPYTGGCSHAGTCSGFLQRCTGCTRAGPETACLLGNRAEASWRQLRAIYKGWDRLAVVGCSRWIARRAAASSALAGIPVSVIPNGIDTGVFFPRPQDASQLRQSLSIAPGERVILFAAPAFTHGKGFDLFLDLARSCAHLPLRFLAAGDHTRHSLPNLTTLGHISGREQMAVLTPPPTFWFCAAGRITSPPSAWKLPPAAPLWWASPWAAYRRPSSPVWGLQSPQGM